MVKNVSKVKNYKITIFYCINICQNDDFLPSADDNQIEFRINKLPCSLMVKDLFFLKAFESGSDAVLVFTCADNACRNLEGNKKADKRVARTKKLLSEAGLNEYHLEIYKIKSGDSKSMDKFISDAIEILKKNK